MYVCELDHCVCVYPLKEMGLDGCLVVIEWLSGCGHPAKSAAAQERGKRFCSGGQRLHYPPPFILNIKHPSTLLSTEEKNVDKLQEWTMDQAVNIIHHFCVSKHRLYIVKGVNACFKNDHLINLMSPYRELMTYFNLQELLHKHLLIRCVEFPVRQQWSYPFGNPQEKAMISVPYSFRFVHLNVALDASVSHEYLISH